MNELKGYRVTVDSGLEIRFVIAPLHIVMMIPQAQFYPIHYLAIRSTHILRSLCKFERASLRAEDTQVMLCSS